MTTLIFLIFILSAFSQEDVETDKNLFSNKKANFLEKMMEENDPGPEDIECIKRADNRNALNRCKNEMKGRKKEEKKNSD